MVEAGKNYSTIGSISHLIMNNEKKAPPSREEMNKIIKDAGPQIKDLTEKLRNPDSKESKRLREIEDGLREQARPLFEALDRSERITAEDLATRINY